MRILGMMLLNYRMVRQEIDLDCMVKECLWDVLQLVKEQITLK